MKNLLLAAMFAGGVCAAVEAAPTDTVTQADLQVLIERLNKLEAENKAQAAKIAELEGAAKNAEAKAEKAVKASAKAAVLKPIEKKEKADKTTEISASGKIYTTESGKKYYLADATANIFEPLSESGLQVTPYAHMFLEGVYSDRQLGGDYTTDWVSRNSQSRNHTTLSVQNSIMGVQFTTPEAINGWKFTGKAEFDLVDTANVDQNHYGFHWRHLYVDAQHAETGWSILFGQYWHLWKMVSPSEIDGAWMENAGHPYRRSPQIRVTKTFDWKDSSLELRAGIVKGGPGMGEDRDKDGIQDNTASAWCLFEGAALYDHVAPWQDKKDALQGQRWLLGAGGMWGRNKSHRFGWNGSSYSFGAEEDEYDSMMGMIAGKVPFNKFTLTGQFYGGQNLGGVQAGCGQTVAYHNFDHGFVKGNAVRAIGGFVDLGYQFNEDWSAAIGYGFDDPVDSDVEGGYNNYDILYNDRLYVAAFYKITANFRLGLEYARLMTSYGKNECGSYEKNGGVYDGDVHANRVQFTAFYDF